MFTTAFINVGTMISGDIRRPFLEADTIVVRGKLIDGVGHRSDLAIDEVDRVVDVKGMTVCPGFIDPHIHPVIGDWSPRVHTIGCLSACLHGGVTRMISQGETHVEGFANDASFCMTLALLAHKTFSNFRPGGIRVHGGALILQRGMTEEDFRRLASEGIWLVAEVGGAGLSPIDEVIPMVRLAQTHGMKVSMHFGGQSIPGSVYVGARDVMRVMPDIIAHINGGSTAAPLDDIETLVRQTEIPFEISFNGNPRVVAKVVEWAREGDCFHRLFLGTDSPTGGVGASPIALLKLLVRVSSLHGVSAADAICMATGNTARAFAIETGRIEPGMQADLLVLDRPSGSSGHDALDAIEKGDTPGIALVMVEGDLLNLRSRFTPFSESRVSVTGMNDREISLEEYFFRGRV